MSANSTGAAAFGEIKYVSIARPSDATILLALPAEKTKKAYAEEVTIFESPQRIIVGWCCSTRKKEETLRAA